MSGLKRVTAASLDVLGLLGESSEPMWGLKVVKELQRPSGTVYPILERLETLGWVVSQWEVDQDHGGPRRRLYVLTPVGRQEWDSLRQRGSRAIKTSVGKLSRSHD